MISIVCPVYNEAGSLEELHSRIASVMDGINEPFELIFVNDGSTDASLKTIHTIVSKDRRVRCVNLSRNFGHQAAITAGMATACGDAMVLMDSDLQDRPEALPQFIEKWRQGFEVVYACRVKRKEGPLKRAAFKFFYRIQSALANVDIPMDAGVFCLMDKRVVDSITGFPESNRYLPGLRAWVGFRQTGVDVERDPRYDKTPRVSFSQLVKLAMDGILSFSIGPLRIATAMSLILGMISLSFLFFIMYHKFFTHKAMPGWSSTLGAVLTIGALQLFSMGLIGEYLGRIYDEVKKRPLYIIREIISADNKSDSND